VLPPLPAPPKPVSTQFDKAISTSNLPPLDDLYSMPDQPHGPDSRPFTPDPTNLTDLRLTSWNDNMLDDVWANHGSVQQYSPLLDSRWGLPHGPDQFADPQWDFQQASVASSLKATTGYLPGNPPISTSGHDPGNGYLGQAPNNVTNNFPTSTSTSFANSSTNPLCNITTSSLNNPTQTHSGSPAKTIIIKNVLSPGPPTPRPVNPLGSQMNPYEFTFTQEPQMPKSTPIPTSSMDQNQPFVHEPINAQRSTVMASRPKSKRPRREATPPETPISGPRHRTRTTNAEGDAYEMPTHMGKSTTARKSRKKKPKE
ncbi:hypothetical protein CPB83DRAFT_841203, partial [Crepidotus variabilis]